MRMGLGFRIGPIWVSTGKSRRKKRQGSSPVKDRRWWRQPTITQALNQYVEEHRHDDRK